MKKAVATTLFIALAISISFAQVFTEQTDIIIPGIYYGSVDWGDFNNDGLLDFMMTGNTGNNVYYSAIYKNNGDNSFTETGNTIGEVHKSSLDWGDYNNDNYIDIILSGIRYETTSYVIQTEIYKNNTNETFYSLTNTGLYKTSNGCVSWGDYGNDGYIDVFQSGYHYADFLTNNTSVIFKRQFCHNSRVL